MTLDSRTNRGPLNREAGVELVEYVNLPLAKNLLQAARTELVTEPDGDFGALKLCLGKVLKGENFYIFLRKFFPGFEKRFPPPSAKELQEKNQSLEEFYSQRIDRLFNFGVPKHFVEHLEEVLSGL